MITSDTGPRLLSRQEAAAYCGVSASTFSGWVSSGHMPKPLFGSRRWDKKAIDARLDGASGLALPAAKADENPLERWLRETNSETRHSVQQTESGSYVRTVDLPTWSEQSLTAPLGKREISAILQIGEFNESGRDPLDSDLKHAGLSTLSKMGARGLLVPNGLWYKMRLSKKGVGIYRDIKEQD